MRRGVAVRTNNCHIGDCGEFFDGIGAYIDDMGAVSDDGDAVDGDSNGDRPAMWIQVGP